MGEFEDALGIKKASDMMVTGNYIPKFMLVGPSGSGKTTALTTFPPEYKVLVLNFFGNPESLEGAENVDFITIQDLKPESGQGWLALEKVKRKLIAKLVAGDFPWDVLAIDTVTGLMKLAMNYTLMTNPKHTNIMGAPAQLHYLGYAHAAEQFIMGFLGFPIITVINAHAETFISEETKLQINRAVMPGNVMRNTVYTYVGEVYRTLSHPHATDPSKSEFKWQCQQDSQWPILKSVLNQKGKYWGKLLNPNFAELFKMRGIKKGG